MAILIALCTLVLLALVVVVVGAPIRRARAAHEDPAPAPAAERAALRREELEAAREAKYREIRDVELDFRTGKLSEDDYRLLDGQLRGEALAILDELDALGGAAEGGGEGSGARRAG